MSDESAIATSNVEAIAVRDSWLTITMIILSLNQTGLMMLSKLSIRRRNAIEYSIKATGMLNGQLAADNNNATLSLECIQVRQLATTTTKFNCRFQERKKKMIIRTD